MTIWITLLISALSIIVPWLLSLLKGGGKLSDRETRQLNHAIYLSKQLEDNSVKLGCQPEGIPEDNPWILLESAAPGLEQKVVGLEVKLELLSRQVSDLTDSLTILAAKIGAK